MRRGSGIAIGLVIGAAIGLLISSQFGIVYLAIGTGAGVAIGAALEARGGNDD
jgi:hypothetical protein